MAEPAGVPPLPYRTRPAQVLLCVGAVLVVAAGAAALAAPGGAASRALLLLLAAIAAGAALRAAATGLRATQETLAACAAGLAVFGAGALDARAGALPAALLAAAFLVLAVLARTTSSARPTRTWVLAAWGAFQVAALHLLPAVPADLRAVTVLGVALVGLLLTFADGRLVPRFAFVTTAPWHVVGVLEGSRTAWTAPAGRRWIAVALVTAAGAGLVVARLRPVLDPFLGPPRVVPLVTGLVTGAAVAGAATPGGPAGIVVAGYAGLLTATLVPDLLSGWPRGLFGPAAAAGGAATAALAVLELTASAEWGPLVLLLLLTALPSGVVALLRPGERPAGIPVTVGCLAGAALLAVPAGALTAGWAATLMTVVFAAALAVDAPPGSRTGTEITAASCAAAAAAVVAVVGTAGALAGVLALQGLLTLAWAAWPGRQPSGAARARTVGAAELVTAAWIACAGAGIDVPEAYTVPLGLGLLMSSGPRLAGGPSWPAWGPGLLVLAVPSALLGLTQEGSLRPALVLAVSGAAMVLAPRRGVRAPLLVGAGAAVTVAVGLAARALPWPIAAALATGAALLAVGARRERFPVAGYGVRLADLR